MEQTEFFRPAPVDDETLEQWVEAGWLTQHKNLSGQRFSDVDFARARLIRDLQDLGVNDDSIPIVLAGAGSRMIPIGTAVPSRYPPIITWLLIATNESATSTSQGSPSVDNV
jgi:chaperone modulatory protein CbpM